MSAVYFIRPIGFDGPIKIGTSNAPLKRMQSLREWCPFPLEILVTVPGNGKLERQFHTRFAHLHESSEWFTAAPELVDCVAQLQAGNFDFSSLPEDRLLPRCPRDESYMTPEWKFSRSVTCRLTGLRHRGAPSEAISQAIERTFGHDQWALPRRISDARGAEFEELKAAAEAMLEGLERFATRPQRRSRAA